MGSCKGCEHVGADFIGRIAIGCDSVSPGDNHVDLSSLEVAACCTITNDLHRNSLFLQFPSGNARPLKKWTCFIGENSEATP